MPAIPFIVYDSDNDKYKVDQSACIFLQSLKGPLGVISIAGKYRTGKSLFLNRVILNERPGRGFGVGSTINACTKGIWIYNKTISCQTSDGQNIQVLVMDSEGIGSLDANSTHDCRIFSLALLLSSFFVYNSVGSIDDSALKTLSLVTNISKQVRIQSDKAASMEELSSIFPSFCWVVRDFTLRLETLGGSSIDSNTYLESALSTKSESKETDTVKQVIKECFPDRTCVTMVRPCQEESDLQNLDNMPDKKLRNVFVSQMKSIRGLIRSKVKVKTFMDNPVSGSMLSTMAETFTKSINEGAAPVIKDSWEMISEIQGRELMDECIELFEQKLQDYNFNGKLTGPEAFDLKLSEWTRASMDHFSMKTMNKNSPFGKKLKSKLSQLCKSAKKSNMETIQRCMEKSISLLKDDIVSASTVEELRSCFTKRSNQLYKQLDKSDVIVGMWSAMKLPFVWKWIVELVKKRDLYVITLEKDKEKNEKIISELQEQLKQCQIDIQTMKISYQEGISKLQSEHKEEMNELQSTFDSRVKNFEQDLSTSNERVKELEDRVMSVTDEYSKKLQEKETEFKTLEVKFEDVTSKSTSMEKECVDLQQMVQELKDKVSQDGTLRLKMAECEQNLSTAHNTIAQLKLSCSNNEQKFKQFMDDMTKDSVRTIDRLKEENSKQKLQIEELSTSHEQELQKLQEESNSIISELKQQLDICSGEIDKVKASSEEVKKRMNEKVRTLSESNQKLSDQLKEDRVEHNSVLDKLRKEGDDYKRTSSSEYKLLQDKFMDQHMKSTTKMRELETKLTCTTVDLQSCKRKLSEMSEESGSRKKMKLDIHRVQSELEKHKSIAEWLEKDKTIKEQRIMDLNQTISKLEKRCHEAERQHEVDMLKMKMAYEHQFEDK